MSHSKGIALIRTTYSIPSSRGLAGTKYHEVVGEEANTSEFVNEKPGTKTLSPKVDNVMVEDENKFGNHGELPFSDFP